MGRDINPSLDVRMFDAGLNPANVEASFADTDAYLDGLGFLALDIRRRLFALCAVNGIPATTVAPLGMGAALLNFVPGGMTFEDYFRREGRSADKQALRFPVGLAPAMPQMSYLVATPRTSTWPTGAGPPPSSACNCAAASRRRRCSSRSCGATPCPPRRAECTSMHSTADSVTPGVGGATTTRRSACCPGWPSAGCTPPDRHVSGPRWSAIRMARTHSFVTYPPLSWGVMCATEQCAKSRRNSLIPVVYSQENSACQLTFQVSMRVRAHASAPTRSDGCRFISAALPTRGDACPCFNLSVRFSDPHPGVPS
jgi:hypothetical protein